MGFKRQCFALYTLMRKECVRIIRIWSQSIIPPAITMTLYFIVFGKLIGNKISMAEGFSYMQFITPGLIMMSIISNSYMNVCSSFFSLKFQKSVEELLVAPINNFCIVLGFAGGGVFRGLLTGTTVCIISLLFTKIQIHSWLIIITFSVLAALTFSLGGFLNALFAKKFDDISIIPTFILIPLTYLGGVFYSINSLPEIWQKVSLANPILYMISGFRYGFLGVSDMSVYTGFAILASFAAALFLLDVFLLHRGTGTRT